VPLLRKERVEARFHALGPRAAFGVAWSFEGGSRLSLVANLSDTPVRRSALAAYAADATPFFATPDAAQATTPPDMLAAWSVSWWQTP
jgi:hypothetical protein